MRLPLTLALLSCLTLGVQAQVILVDDLAQAQPVYSPVGGPTSSAPNFQQAVSFFTGSYQGSLGGVDAVILPDFSFPGTADGVGTNLHVFVYSDNAGIPGSSIGALAFTPPPQLGLNPTHFFPVLQISLLSNSVYWVVATADKDAKYVWQRTTAGPTRATSDDAGSSWFTSAASSLTVRVTGVVPELEGGSAATPLCVIFTAMALCRSRRRAAAAV